MVPSRQSDGARHDSGRRAVIPVRVFEGRLSEQDERRLNALFCEVPRDVFSLPPHEKHTALFSFLKNAGRAGVSAPGAMKYLRIKKYAWRVAHWKARDKEQVPHLLVLSNTSGVNPAGIITGAPSFEHGVQHGGVFGPAINVRETSHVTPSHDLTPVAYILNHLLEHGKNIPPYLWVFGESNPSKPQSQSFEQCVRLALYRRDEFKQSLCDAGFLVSKNHVFLSGKGERRESLLLLAVVYDASQREFKVVEHAEGGKFSSTSFEQFVESDASLKANPLVRAHVENARAHRASDVHYQDYSHFRESGKTVLCVDCRSTRPDAGAVVKTIGAVLSERDFLRIAKGNPQLDTIEVYFHTPCGYVNSAIALHNFFKELASVLPEGSEEREAAFSKIEAILRGEHADLDVATYSAALRLSPETAQTLAQLFGARGDLRNILRHMAEHGVFASKKEGFAMVAAASVEEKLSKWRVHVEPAHFKMLVLEELVRIELARKARLLDEHKQEIEQARGGPASSLSFGVEDYKTGRIWIVPPQLAKSNVSSTTRDDAFLPEPVDVSHFMNAEAGGKQ